MDIDSKCQICARKDCPDAYNIHKHLEEQKGMEIIVKSCRLFCFADPNKPADYERMSWTEGKE